MGIEKISNGKKNSPSIPVFVSSTYEDLKECRREIRDILSELGLEPHGMEEFGSRNEAPLQTCLDEVSRCDIFICILAMQYGSIEKSTGKSFTELEYDEATKIGAYILSYLVDEEKARVHPKHVDLWKKASKLKKFKQKVKKRTVYFFESDFDLKIRVEKDLRRLLFDEKGIDTGIKSVGDGIAEHPGEGKIALTASGTGYYNIGDKILLSGINTDSPDVYLFVTGPNLKPDGGMLGNLEIPPISSQPRTFTRVPVDPDGTWMYEWDTSKVAKHLVTGNYALFAVSKPFSKDEMHEAENSRVDIRLNNPYITASLNSGRIAQGNELVIAGTATGNPAQVYLWIFGDDYRLLWQPIDVEKDSTYQFKISTKQFTTGQYFVIVQHPMHNSLGSVRAISQGSNEGSVFVIPRSRDEQMNPIDVSSLSGSGAALAVLNLLCFHEIDDTYAQVTFCVEKPWITILPIEPQRERDSILVSGRTNLAEGSELILFVTRADREFIPWEKHIFRNMMDSIRGNEIIKAMYVEKADPCNEWSTVIDKLQLSPGDYKISVWFVSTGTHAEETMKYSGILNLKVP